MVALVSLCASRLTAQEAIGIFDDEAGANKIELTGVFAPPPPGGYQPVRVQVTNATGEKRSWRLEFSSSVGWNSGGETKSTFEIPAESGSAQSTVLVPVQAAISSGSWSYGGGQHHLRATLISSQGRRHGHENYAERAHVFPAIAISDALAQKSLTQLNDETGKAAGSSYSREKIFGSRFVPDHLPDHWLGYSGFDHVMMTTDEWLAAAPGIRTAILETAHFGLHLHLYRTSDSVSFGSLGFAGAAADATTLPHGMGRIVLDTWDGDALDAAATVAKFSPLRGEAAVERVSKEFASGSWGLERALGERSFAGWQVVVFLLVFGILIGPINLFVLAPAGKRHRLFFTTPALSLGASLLLIGLILLQDGTGGQGRRFIAVHLPPGSAAAHVSQEQISRTGVVLGSSFSLPRPSHLTQVVLPESPWAKFNEGSASQSINGRIDGAQISGNWFQSRSVQGQVLRSLVPTRGRIEVVPAAAPGQPPSIVSSLEFDLATFGYLDAAGGLWRAEGTVSQGRPVTLVKDDLVNTDGTGWSERLKKIQDSCSPGLASRITATVANRPAFFATASGAPGFAIDTLPSIRWQDDQIVVFGNLPATP